MLLFYIGKLVQELDDGRRNETCPEVIWSLLLSPGEVLSPYILSSNAATNTGTNMDTYTDTNTDTNTYTNTNTNTYTSSHINTDTMKLVQM